MKLYSEFADWWHLLSSPQEYTEEAGIYDRLIRESLEGSQQTLLELGSGGGNNASHLKASWKMTLVDPSDGMLANSRNLNPECEHLLGDMRTIRLGRTFDAVFIHDAICHMTTLEDVRKALTTAFVHTRAGGALLIAPDDTKENYLASTNIGGNDGPERGVRYIKWSYDPDPDDCTAVTDYAYLLREADGSVHVAHDRLIHGLFWRQDWLDAFAATGFVKVRGVLAEHSELEPGSYELFVGVKPPSACT